MSARSRRVLLLVGAAFLWAAVWNNCPARSRATEVGKTDWLTLFDGQTIDAWEIVGGPADCWAIDGGELVPRKAGGWLSTKETFADFELELEFNLPPGGNSGVFLRAPRTGRTSRTGMEIQLLDDAAEKYRDLKPWQKCGSLYHVEAARSGAALPAGTWQKMRVRAEGRALRVWLNDRLVVDTRLDRYPQLEAEHPGLKRASGYIGLQNYGGSPVRFRNIRVRRL